MPRHPIDPRCTNICFDANAFDRAGDGTDVDRLLALRDAGELNLIALCSVRAEMQRPNTPTAVRQIGESQIFSVQVKLNEEERRRHAQVRAIVQGNAAPGKHDADAHHVCEAAKYGGYFITHDRRINQTKRAELEAVLPRSLWIVTLSEFLAIYDRYAATDHA